MALLMFNSLRGNIEDWAPFFKDAYPDLEIREWQFCPSLPSACL